jgi:hypothetical protein
MLCIRKDFFLAGEAGEPHALAREREVFYITLLYTHLISNLFFMLNACNSSEREALGCCFFFLLPSPIYTAFFRQRFHIDKTYRQDTPISLISPCQHT